MMKLSRYYFLAAIALSAGVHGRGIASTNATIDDQNSTATAHNSTNVTAHNGTTTTALFNSTAAVESTHAVANVTTTLAASSTEAAAAPQIAADDDDDTTTADASTTPAAVVETVTVTATAPAADIDTTAAAPEVETVTVTAAAPTSTVTATADVASPNESASVLNTTTTTTDTAAATTTADAAVAVLPPVPGAGEDEAASVVVTGACAAVAADPIMGAVGWFTNDKSAELAGAQAVMNCNAAFSEDGITPVPGANCTVMESFCGENTCVGISFNTDSKSFIYAVSNPGPKSVAIAEALGKCTETVCANTDAVTNAEEMCNAGNPVCYIHAVVCGKDSFYFNYAALDGDSSEAFYAYFDDDTAGAGYLWSDGETPVTGTIANLNGDSQSSRKCDQKDD